jgi:hypothetical protein
MADIVENNITARVLLNTEAPASTPALNVPLIVDGSARVTHALTEEAGLPGKFGDQADHTHFEHRNFHTSLKQNAVIYMFRGHGNPNSVSLAGRSNFWTQTEYNSANEDSIDTTATAQNPSSPDYKATVKLRYTTNVAGLTLNAPIILHIQSVVAGIQAAMYGGKVTQVPTLVNGKYEVLVEINGFDSLHWNWNNKADTSALNANWRLLYNVTPVQTNKNGIDGNYEGRGDQVLVKFNAAHGLALGDCVVLNVAGTLTGLSGLSSKPYSGYVSKVVSSTQVAVVLGIVQLVPETHPTTSGSTTVTSWDLYTGVIDPFHELMLPAQCWTFWRNSAGLTSRVQIGALTTVESNNAAALGFDNFLKSGADSSHIVGSSNKITSGTNAGIFGNSNTSEGNDSIIIGKSNNLTTAAAGKGAFGHSNNVLASNSYNLGQNNYVGQFCPTSMCVGHNNTISSSTNTCYTVGYSNIISSNGSADAGAFGHSNTINNGGAYLFGRGLTSAGQNETAIGWGNSCKIRFDSAAAKLHLADGMSMACGSTSGNKIASATTEKLAFHGATPVVQRAGAAQAAVATTAATNVSPYGFTTAAQADGIVTLLNEIRAVMVEKGLMKGAA